MKFLSIGVLLFSGLIIPYSIRAAEDIPHLLHDLRSQQAAIVEQALHRLQHANLRPLGLPCQELSCQQPQVDVRRVDDMLLVLGQMWQRHTERRHLIESIILRWNFCAVNEYNRPHQLRQDHILQTTVTQAVARAKGWPGLAMWGFSEHDPKAWIRPDMLVHSGLDATAKRQLLYRLIRKQCVPDPWTGRTIYDPEPQPYVSFYRREPQESVLFLPPEVQQKPKPIAKKIIGHKKIKPVHKPHAPMKHHHPKPPMLPRGFGWYDRVVEQHGVAKLKLSLLDKPVIRSDAQIMLVGGLQMVVALPSEPHGAASGLRMVASLPMSSNQPAKQDVGVQPTMRTEEALWFPQDQSGIYGQDAWALPTSPNTSLAGDIQLRWRLKDNSYALASRVRWSPYRHWAVQAGLNVPLLGPNRVASYTWGMDYNNPNLGAFSLGLHQWNPQTLKTPPRLKNMEWKLGYHVNIAQFLPLSPRWQSDLGLSFYQGVPTLSNQWQYNIGDGWYIRAGLGKQLARNKPYHVNDWGWTYGFGRAKWQAGSLNIEYANWGFNRVPQANFRKNGEVLLTWRWKIPWN